MAHRREGRGPGTYEGAGTVAAADGAKVASDPEVVALCEKRLVGVLHDFLARQPNVTHVPTIRVSYVPLRGPKGQQARSSGT